MTETPPATPRSLAQLRGRVRTRAKAIGRTDWVMERLVANVVTGQMLPPGVVKGGTALKIRVGDEKTRFSRDLDAAHAAEIDLDQYLDALDANLQAGWNGITGTIRGDRPVKAPPSVPDDYVMRRFKIALAYKGSAWLAVEFELGRDEVGSTERAEKRMAQDVVDFFLAIGLPAPAPIPLLPVDHQIAQKLHACTSTGAGGENERAHDLVDLQVLVREEKPDLGVAGTTARRLFASRRTHPWPPTVVAFDLWASIYAEAAAGLDALPNVGEAVQWANTELVAKMDEASRQASE